MAYSPRKYSRYVRGIPNADGERDLPATTSVCIIPRAPIPTKNDVWSLTPETVINKTTHVAVKLAMIHRVLFPVDMPSPVLAKAFRNKIGSPYTMLQFGDRVIRICSRCDGHVQKADLKPFPSDCRIVIQV